MPKLALVATAAVSLVALGACTINPAPTPMAPAPATTVITPPAPMAQPGNTVVVPGHY